MKYPCDAVPTSTAISDRRAPVTEGRWILAATILGSSMAFIDGTVVNVAMPSLQGSFHATVSDVLWVVDAYLLVLSALILVGGSLGDLYGRRRIYAIGVVVFALASAWCGLASDIRWLIVARAAQGVGAALLIPGSLALISAAFPTERRGKAIGTWSGFTGITAAIGPVLGGWLVQHLSWRWVFFINLPIAALVLLLLFWHVPESRASQSGQKLDLLGAMLMTFGLGGLVFALIEAPARGWRHPAVYGSLGASILAIVLFLLLERRRKSPLVPLRLFVSSDFSGANLLTLLLYAALGTVLFFLPFDLIQVHGYTPTQAGAANLPFILTLFFLSSWAGGLVSRYGARLPLVLGPLVTALGFALFARPGTQGSYWSTFFPATLILGLGMTAVVAPLTTTVMNSVDGKEVGVASGINNAVSRIASLLAIAVFGMILSYVFGSQLRDALASAPIPENARSRVLQQQSRLTQIEVPSELDPAQKQGVKRAIDLSFVAAFRRVMLLSAGLALLSSASAWGLISGRKQQRQMDALHTA
jgi:EmrB/QacA subfamily drug resistance transporter